eukprot:CAMPEP_0202687422 /NCGR_PEP_ID=MMETSP1385-20130828/3103_1 /ASSEMBLY_ACC=CAM_ASM_000861 /TAXON_ID=933848 /ORGANISM="Elphidium margaritaceum" /LENGTH=189 /DNA_ID=CAMNT_0049342207 /DNA_START=94 /DNA_END=663 /DNA_ORIENTATION=-
MPRPVFCKNRQKGRVAFKKDDRPITKIVRNKWYPFNVQKIKRGVNNPTKLRRGLTPGTVVVLLTGPYRGRRVVYLKQLKQSGLLLVTGPFAVNGVPLRRVGQRFVIITSTKIDLSKVTGIDKVEDDYFKRPKVSKKATEKPKLPEEKKQTQLNIDNQILSIVEKEELMKVYLSAYFTIVPGQPPHAIKF